MPKKKRQIEDQLESIQYLLAGLLLKNGISVKTVSKIIGVSDKEITKKYPQKKKKKSDSSDLSE